MSKITILIVEDEAIVAEDLASRLAIMSYEVADTVDSAPEAIAAATTLKPDLILMDIRLSGQMDGTEAAGQINAQLKIPVVYLTAYADEDTLERAKITNPFGYILKPFTDRDLRVNIEIALSRHQGELTVKRALTQAKDRQQQAIVQSQQKSQYLSLTSSKLRTPLATIGLAAASLRRHSYHWTESQKQQYFQSIQEEIERIDCLLRDVLTLSKTEASPSLDNSVSLDLTKFCQAILGTFRKGIGNQHQLVFCSQNPNLRVYFDQTLLWHLLSNLLDNAIKYSPPQSIVHLKVLAGQTKIYLQVQDRGIGIPPTDQNDIFTPFYRARNVGEIPGTGLGLAIIKRIVDLYQGQINLESKTGQGTRVTVTLPMQSSTRVKSTSDNNSEFSGSSLSPQDLRLILRYINENLAQELTLADMAAVLSLSPYHFGRQFKQAMNIAPYQYLIQQRIERVKHLLKPRKKAIADITLECGFSSQSQLTQHFRKLTGYTPKAYRNQINY